MRIPRDRSMRAALRLLVLLLVTGSVGFSALPSSGQTAITTYHYDNYRTGWNQSETALTPANVGTASLRIAEYGRS